MHDGAGPPAVFGPGILFRFELVDGIHGKNRSRVTGGHHRVKDALAHPGVRGMDAVDQVNVVLRAQAVGALGPARAARIDGHAGPQLEQVFKIAAIQGQVIDDLGLQRAAEFGVRGLDDGKLSSYGDFFRLLTGLQSQIEAQVLVDLERVAGAFGSLKALNGRTYRISAGQKIGDIVFTGAVGGYRAREISLRIENRDRGANDGAAALVGDSAEDATGIALGK